MTAGRICCICHQPIIGEAREVVRHSASGARPNDYVHPSSCPVREPVRSMLARYRPRRP